MLTPEMHTNIARLANMLGGIASGEGDFELANLLWRFEHKHEQQSERARERQAEDLREGRLRDMDMPLLHALRVRGLITDAEFERGAAQVERRETETSA